MLERPPSCGAPPGSQNAPTIANNMTSPPKTMQRHPAGTARLMAFSGMRRVTGDRPDGRRPGCQKDATRTNPATTRTAGDRRDPNVLRPVRIESDRVADARDRSPIRAKTAYTTHG